jgi:hypothetical protein
MSNANRAPSVSELADYTLRVTVDLVVKGILPKDRALETMRDALADECGISKADAVQAVRQAMSRRAQTLTASASRPAG